MREEVLHFIARFTDENRRPQVIDTFTNGCCYWFARILAERFQYSNTTIVYDQIANHFGCCINEAIYDITGDVTTKYKWEPWSYVKHTDKLLANRIIRDCVDF